MKKKPQRVDTVCVGHSRTNVELYLDRNDLDFFATLGLETVRAPSIEELRSAVSKKLQNWQPEQWEEYIAVRADEDQTVYSQGGNLEHATDISFRFYRGERATKLDGGIVERAHRLDRQAKLDSSRSRGHEREEFARRLENDVRAHWAPDDYVILPYSDVAWEKLCALKKELLLARKRLVNLVKRKDFTRLLVGDQVKLLARKP